MNNESLNGTLVLVRPDLTIDPANGQGKVAIVTYDREQSKEVYVAFNNGQDVTKQATIPYTALDGPLIKKVKDLFKAAYQKRLLIRLVGVRLSNLVNGFEQIDLYSESEEQYSLCQAMDKIRRRFGPDSIKLASGINLNL